MISAIRRIVDWNEKRYPQVYNKDLQNALLGEEIGEFFDAETEVDQLDALVDTVYIAIGAMWKMGLSPEQIREALQTVCDSNDSKDAKMNDPAVKANMDKGENYVAPEPKLQEILNAR